MLFSSTEVKQGQCWGIVAYTGMNTAIGSVHEEVMKAKEEEEDTPLKKALDDFGDKLAKVIPIICFIVWVMNFNKWSDPIHGSFIKGCIYYLKIAIALAVAAIPRDFLLSLQHASLSEPERWLLTIVLSEDLPQLRLLDAPPSSVPTKQELSLKMKCALPLSLHSVAQSMTVNFTMLRKSPTHQKPKFSNSHHKITRIMKTSSTSPLILP
jgi:hypothetical protein